MHIDTRARTEREAIDERESEDGEKGRKKKKKKRKRERRNIRDGTIVVQRGRVERRVRRNAREDVEGKQRADGRRSTNMVDRPWMSGGAHGVTHAPHLAIRARASSLIK